MTAQQTEEDRAEVIMGYFKVWFQHPPGIAVKNTAICQSR
jgi:hypothetical protein